jgi:uncharacterized Tic20 family protein
MAGFLLVSRCGLWIIYFTMAIIGTVHRDDECGSSQLGLAMVLALAASCTQAAFFLMCDLLGTFIIWLMPKDSPRTSACETTNLTLSSLPTIFGFCVGIFLSVQLAKTSRSECSDVLYNVALGSAITFLVNTGLHLGLILGTCCCAYIALLVTRRAAVALLP